MKGRVFLRALSKEDAKLSWKWRNDDTLKYFYSGHPFSVNLKQEEEWIEKVSMSNIPTTSFGIEELESNQLIGMTFIKDINLIHRRGEFAIFIGDEKYKGRGYAKEASLKVIDFVFNSLNINRLSLKVQEDNIGAIKLYEKIGFKAEGFLRRSVFKNGSYINEILMSILKEEYVISYEGKKE